MKVALLFTKNPGDYLPAREEVIEDIFDAYVVGNSLRVELSNFETWYYPLHTLQKIKVVPTSMGEDKEHNEP